MLEAIGAFTVGAVLLAFIILALTIALNIICGMRGAVRLQRVLKRDVALMPLTGWIIRQGFRAWHGPRYDGQSGEYWQAGGFKVPLDIRDPIRRTRFYGA